MKDALTPDDREVLSSYLDHETEKNTDIESQLTQSFSAQVHFRNLEALSRASQQQQPTHTGSADFLSRLMFAVEDLEQEDPTADLECVSAWYDQEFELDRAEVMTQSAEWVQNLSSLTQAIRALPQAEATTDFSAKVMQAIAVTLEPSYETLSASFDKANQFQDVREFSAADRKPSTQTHLRNLKNMSRAIQRLNVPAASAGFAEQVRQALPQRAQDLSDLSAWYDQEANFETKPDTPWQEQFKQLSQLFTQAKTYEGSPDFIAGLNQRLDDIDQVSIQWNENMVNLTQALQALPSPQAPANFVSNLMNKIDGLAADLNYESQSAIYDNEQAGVLSTQQSQSFVVLTQALRALPQQQAPTGFAEQVMQAIDAQADFETLSAWHDQELDTITSQLLEQNGQQTRLDLKHIQTLSKAIQALPQKEAPQNFLARVMLATEQETLAPASKAKLFALPGILGTFMGQMAAAFAIFGVLVMVSQIMLDQSQPRTTGVTAAVPSNYIVQVEHQPEDLLFSSNVNTLSVDSSLVMEATLENVSEIDYNLMIGG